MASGRYTPSPVANAGDVTTLNQNLQNISDALDNVVSRQPNNLPNSMNTNLDMNGYFILNQGNPVTLTSFNYRGVWEPATLYQEGDAVSYNSSSYICQVDNTSSSVFLTDLLADKWTDIVLGQKYQGEWVGPNTAYYIGDIVFVSGDSFYVCIENSFSTNSFNNDVLAGYWEQYGDTLGTMALQNANAVAITGGSITGTSLTSSSVNLTGGSIAGVGISGGTINNTVIGGTTPAAATFTTALLTGAISGGNQAVTKSYVDAAFTTGSIALPGGLILKYGTSTVALAGITSTMANSFRAYNIAATTVNFGAAFPNAVLYVAPPVITQYPKAASEGWANAVQVNSTSTSGFTYDASSLSQSASAADQDWIFSWFAIGN